MNNQSLWYLTLTLSLINLAGLMWVWQSQRSLSKLRKTFFAGKSGTDLESVLMALSADLQSAKNEQLVLEQHLTQLKSAFKYAVQKSGMIRFNPFADTGGNLSFSLALLDGENSGVVITNMHSREHNRIYLKKIVQGKSEIPLTEEELQAISSANR